jgi:SAM-dependent methyltransferase
MRQLPDDFIAGLEATAAAYLTHSDPIRQSGFGGGEVRWRAEREPILDAVNRPGTLIDIGCANGYLLECLEGWATARGLRIDPFGLDISPALIERARARFPGREDHFCLGNAWTWDPPRRFEFVYSLYDCVPETYLVDYVRGLLARVVAPGGRLILGAYGSRTRNLPAFDVAAFMRTMGLAVVGETTVGSVPEAQFAWTDAAAE